MEVMKMLIMAMRRNKLNTRASGDGPVQILNRRQCPPPLFWCSYYRKQYPRYLFLKSHYNLCFSVSRTLCFNNINNSNEISNGSKSTTTTTTTTTSTSTSTSTSSSSSSTTTTTCYHHHQTDHTRSCSVATYVCRTLSGLAPSLLSCCRDQE